MSSRRSSPRASAWLVVGLCFLALALAFSARTTLGLVMPVWVRELGWTKSFISGAGAAALIVMAWVASFRPPDRPTWSANSAGDRLDRRRSRRSDHGVRQLTACFHRGLQSRLRDRLWHRCDTCCLNRRGASVRRKPRTCHWCRDVRCHRRAIRDRSADSLCAHGCELALELFRPGDRLFGIGLPTLAAVRPSGGAFRCVQRQRSAITSQGRCYALGPAAGLPCPVLELPALRLYDDRYHRDASDPVLGLLRSPANAERDSVWHSIGREFGGMILAGWLADRMHRPTLLAGIAFSWLDVPDPHERRCELRDVAAVRGCLWHR